MELGFLFAIGASIVWGLTYIILEKILVTLGPLMLLFVSSVVTVLVLTPFMVFSGELRKTDLVIIKTSFPLVFLVVILSALANFLIFSSIKRLDAATASIIEISYPFFVVLFGFLFFQAAPNLAFFVGSSLVFVGTIIIIKFAE